MMRNRPKGLTTTQLHHRAIRQQQEATRQAARFKPDRPAAHPDRPPAVPAPFEDPLITQPHRETVTIDTTRHPKNTGITSR